MSGQRSLFDCCSKGGSLCHKDEESIGRELLPDTFTPDDKNNKLIDQILKDVGLLPQKDTIVGGVFKRGLSGGQKRLLSGKMGTNYSNVLGGNN